MGIRLVTSVFVASLVALPSYAANKVIGSFDGFCDGFNLTLKSNGSASGQMTGCGSGLIAGAFTNKQIVYSPQISPPLLYIINEQPRTFLIYNSKGKIQARGTWSPGFPLSKPDLPSTTTGDD